MVNWVKIASEQQKENQRELTLKAEKFLEQDLDWENMIKLKGISHRGENPVYLEALSILQERGVLNYEGIEGTYFILGSGGLDLSPRDPNRTRRYWFKEEKDAIEFAIAEYGNCMFEVRVAKMTSRIK